jgi:hypothetical protein
MENQDLIEPKIVEIRTETPFLRRSNRLGFQVQISMFIMVY